MNGSWSNKSNNHRDKYREKEKMSHIVKVNNNSNKSNNEMKVNGQKVDKKGCSNRDLKEF